MKISTKARLTSAVLLGVLGAVALRLSNLKHYHQTRDEFLADQAARYDRLLAVHPRLFATIAAGIIVALLLVGIYELIVLGVSRVIGGGGEGSHGS